MKSRRKKKVGQVTTGSGQDQDRTGQGCHEQEGEDWYLGGGERRTSGNCEEGKRQEAERLIDARSEGKEARSAHRHTVQRAMGPPG